MNEKKAKRERLNLRIKYAYEFEKWLKTEPKRIHFVKWKRWKENRPRLKED